MRSTVMVIARLVQFLQQLPWTINRKLLSGFLLVLSIPLVVGVASTFGIATLTDTTRVITGEVFPSLIAIRALKNDAHDLRDDLCKVIFTNGAPDALEEFKGSQKKWEKDFQTVATGVDATEEPAAIARINADYARFNTTNEAILQLVRAGKTKEAGTLFTGPSAQAVNALEDAVDGLIRLNQEQATRAIAHNRETGMVIIRLIIVGLLLACFLGLLVSFLLNGAISTPLRDAAKLLATRPDDLALRLPVSSNDEIGLLFSAYNAGKVYQSEAEAALRQANQQNREILESITDSFCSFNQQWEFIYLNARAEQLLGLPRQEVLGKSFWEIFPDLVGTIYYDEFHRALAEQIPVTFENFVQQTSAWYDIRVYPSRQGISVYTNDITARKQAELAQQAIAKTKDRFLTLVSHELRNPLASVVGFGELLHDRLTKLLQSLIAEPTQAPVAKRIAKLVDFAARIEQQGKYMTAQINDLLDMSRLETGKFSLKLAPCDLALIARQAIAAQQVLSARHSLSYHGLAQLEITADASRLQQVLINLLANAMRYSPAGGTIAVTLREQSSIPGGATAEAPGIYLSVSDRGLGIAAENLPHIFEYTYQVERTGEEERTGLGLGLYLGKEIVEQHGGTITVESRVGEGSTFTIWLPLQLKQPERGTEEARG